MCLSLYCTTPQYLCRSNLIIIPNSYSIIYMTVGVEFLANYAQHSVCLLMTNGKLSSANCWFHGLAMSPAESISHLQLVFPLVAEAFHIADAFLGQTPNGNVCIACLSPAIQFNNWF